MVELGAGGNHSVIDCCEQAWFTAGWVSNPEEFPFFFLCLFAGELLYIACRTVGRR
jgi:hypothetical protein